MLRSFCIIFFIFSFLTFSQNNDSIPKTYNRTFKENIPDKYTNKNFVYVEPIEKELSFFEKFKQWLAEFFKNLFGLDEGEEAFSFTGKFLNFLAIIIVLIVVYIILKALINKEGFGLFSKGNNKLMETSSFEENINEINFEKVINQAKSNGEQRQVIRLYYLWLLKTFSDKNLIKWDKDKTNADYLYEIQNERIKEDFAYLSYLYNYTWYGHVEISGLDFEKMNESFEKTLKSLGS